MRIRAIEVRNWACIESLSLTGLADGIVVLHGPNRTGKSSLVQAIRSAVFDHDHDSQKSTLLAALPWKTKAAPHVAVEFDHAGARYRITKTFAKTKEGQASLEQHTGGDWSVIVKGKEASKKVRELIGAETSEAGVFQMLWLGQRDFELPRADAIDPTLEASLEAVLGTLITGRDIDFKAALDKACERWFTVKVMKDKVGSPATRLATELQDALVRKADVDRQWTDAESALREYDEALARLPELKRNVEQAFAELETAQKACEGIRQRKSHYDLADKNRQQCDRLFKQAEERLREFDEAARQLEAEQLAVGNLELARRTAEERRGQEEQAAVQLREAAHHAETLLATHQQNRGVLDDREQLIRNQVERGALEEKLCQVSELEAHRGDLEEKLADAAVPTNERIVALRGDRDRAAGLRARLEAAEIHVTIHAKAALPLTITSDGEPGQGIQLAESQEQRWLVRQNAELQIGEWATIRIGRGEEDRDLEDLARDLATVEASLRDALNAANVDPVDPAAIDQLATRRLQHDDYARQLSSLRGAIAKAAPAGLPALQAELRRKQEEQQLVLTRRPELVGWSPDPSELARLRFEFANQETSLQVRACQAKEAADRAAEAIHHIRSAEQEIRTNIATRAVKIQSLKDQLGRTDRAALTLDKDQAAERLAEAQRKVAESTLTDAEQAMESHHDTIKAAHTNRAERLRTNENRLLELRTKLAGTEGLHQKRIQAEQTVHDLAREHQRESLYASAHKHLKELFEEVRQEQVRRTVGPISNRVMNWSKQLGLADLADLSFADQLLPVGFVPGHSGDGSAVELARESFGTLEQLSLLVRLAVGGLLSQNEPAAAILDDPLAHADPGKHRKMLDILDRAARGEPHGPHPTGPLQIIILTCHADRFDYLAGAQQFDLATLIRRGS